MTHWKLQYKLRRFVYNEQNTAKKDITKQLSINSHNKAD